MMLFKLSIQNLHKSLKDYTIYFATLIIGVAIFYVFNSMEKQTIMMKTSSATYGVIKLMNSTMAAISVFVAFVLGCLIVYASNFLMKRRKKEFGIYMLLGMEKGRIARIIMMETIIIGLVSLALGLTVGIIASQGMSILVAKLFEADMTKYQFVVSYSAIGKTVIYFVIMYLVVLVLDTFVVGKAKLIDLLHAAKKTEKNTAKNPVVCVVVFLIAAVLLGTAYYQVTAGMKDITTEKQIVIQIGKGVIGTFLVFWSVSGLLFSIVSKNKKFYYRGLNSFTIRELGGRINTTVFSGSIICLMLFITICVLSSATTMRKTINDNLKEMTPVDLNLILYMYDKYYDYTDVSSVLNELGVDTGRFKDIQEITAYTAKDGGFTMGKTMGMALDKMTMDPEIRDYYENYTESLIKVSDYNKMAELYGLKTYSLEDDEYMIVANFGTMVDMRNAGLKENVTLDIGGKEYHAKYQECQSGFLYNASNNVEFGFFLVPDDVNLEDYKPMTSYYAANYASDSASSYIESDSFKKMIHAQDERWGAISISSRQSIRESSIGLTAMIIFIGIYLGIIFMIASAAILALKELSEAADNKEKYAVLRRIGVDEKQMYHSLFVQSLVFFGMPLVLACIHSIFGIQTCNMILEQFGNTGLLYSILVTAGMILLVYGMYFIITYSCSKKIIKDRRN